MNDFDELTTADLCRLLGVSRQSLSDLARRGVIVLGDKRGTYKLEASINGYCEHLRSLGQAGAVRRERRRVSV